MNPSTKSKLLRLTRQKDSTAIKSFLESSPKEIKGKLFEQYLAELYRGNGWLVEIKAGRGDLGADILLYHPKTPSRVSLITQAKNHAKPLTFDQTKIELVKFEEQAAPKYNCQQFNLVAVNGFARTAEQLGEFNMLLYAWDYVAGLIERYDPDHKTEPEIELYAHNKITYERCKELWQESNYVAVVQATGTGKSYIIAKVMADFLGSKKLVMAPSNYILEQQRSKVSWASESTIYMTYARGANLTDKEIQDLGVKLIVLDEFHRCGAEMWGAGVEKILNTYPDSYVFGTTATPIRYLDANRDMSDEIFDGVVAENLPLAKAIVRKILPAPTYVAALYTLEEEFEYLEEILAKSKKSEAEKNEIAVEIGRIRFTWEKTSGVPQILKKHLKPETNKFIIFCKDQNHLDQMEVEVQRWFQKLKIHRWRKVYRVLSDDPESDQNLEAFKDSKSKDTVHLLFAIDMLNEGLHIFEVGCVILLRPTESPRIFYQQIGRCMQVNAENAPIIVDLVNNFQSIRADDFLENLNEARDAERKRRADFGLGEYTPEIHITDETKDILEVFEEISERLSAWEVMFQHLCEYVDREGHARVPNSYITSDGFKLGNWVSSRRMDYKKSKLSEDRIRALEELPGWSWDPLEEQWFEGFEQLKKYIDREGHAKVPNTYITSEGFKLGSWVSVRRTDYKFVMLSEDRIRALEELPGWSWNVKTEKWIEAYEQLKKYKDLEGHARVPQGFITSDGFKLGKWVIDRRRNYKKGELSDDHIWALEELPGWIWDTHEEHWIEGYEQLKKYIDREGHARVPAIFISSDRFKLGNWVDNKRRNYKKGKLSEDRIRALEELSGWIWDIYEEQWFEGFEQLKKYIDREGHAKVPNTYITSEGFKLGSWVVRQRREYKKGKLSEDRIGALEELLGWSWDWDPIEDMWNNGYEQLKKYMDREGHARVSRSFVTSDGLKLGRWIINRRMDYKKSKLSEDRIRALEELPGWSWDPNEEKWIKGFEQLKKYIGRKGHARVPYSFITSDGFKLGIWVSVRRRDYKEGKLSDDRIRALERIGFEWKIK